MAIILMLRVAILSCLFLGGLFASIAIFENKWQKYAVTDQYNHIILNAGLWEYCITQYQASFYQYNKKETRCRSVNNFLIGLNELESMNLLITKKNIKKIKGNYFFN